MLQLFDICKSYKIHEGRADRQVTAPTPDRPIGRGRNGLRSHRDHPGAKGTVRRSLTAGADPFGPATLRLVVCIRKLVSNAINHLRARSVELGGGMLLAPESRPPSSPFGTAFSTHCPVQIPGATSVSYFHSRRSRSDRQRPASELISGMRAAMLRDCKVRLPKLATAPNRGCARSRPAPVLKLRSRCGSVR